MKDASTNYTSGSSDPDWSNRHRQTKSTHQELQHVLGLRINLDQILIDVGYLGNKTFER